MRAVLDIVLIILDLYVWLLIASAILSWLMVFNVVNTRNQFVAMAADFLYRITEPLLRPIRSAMPQAMASVTRRSNGFRGTPLISMNSMRAGLHEMTPLEIRYDAPFGSPSRSSVA